MWAGGWGGRGWNRLLGLLCGVGRSLIFVSGRYLFGQSRRPGAGVSSRFLLAGLHTLSFPAEPLAWLGGEIQGRIRRFSGLPGAGVCSVWSLAYYRGPERRPYPSHPEGDDQDA